MPVRPGRENIRKLTVLNLLARSELDQKLNVVPSACAFQSVSTQGVDNRFVVKIAMQRFHKRLRCCSVVFVLLSRLPTQWATDTHLKSRRDPVPGHFTPPHSPFTTRAHNSAANRQYTPNIFVPFWKKHVRSNFFTILRHGHKGDVIGESFACHDTTKSEPNLSLPGMPPSELRTAERLIGRKPSSQDWHRRKRRTRAR